MEITIKINTENEKDQAVINRFLSLFDDEEQEKTAEPKEAKKTRSYRRKSKDNEAESAVVEEPTAEQNHAEEQPIQEETAGVAEDSSDVETPQEVAPAEEPKAEAPKTCSPEEWRKAFDEKKNELLVCDGQKYAAKRPLFLDFVHNLSAPYGDRIPSKLTPEKRAEFLAEFKSITYNEDAGFQTNYLPF